MTVKRAIPLTAALLCAVSIMLSSCAKASDNLTTSVSSLPTAVTAETTVAETQAAVVENSNGEPAALLNSAPLPDETAGEDMPFSSYSFEFTHYSDKYMITGELNDDNTAVELTVEDNNFGFATLEVSAPENYGVNIPFSQSTADSLCGIITNTVDDTDVPDILEFTFYLENFESGELPFSVSKFYTIKDNALTEIKVIDCTGETERVLPYCPDSYLYHTEAMVFMPSPQVKSDEEGGLYADVYTYTFDPEECTLRYAVADTSAEDTLYYGYAAKAVADNIFSYFSMTNLNVSDYENYIAEKSLNSDIDDYFFKVDDPRFKTLEELKAYVGRYFTPALTDKMFIGAPQKYKDINGALYTIVGDGGWDETLGKITICGFTVNGDNIIYHTKQEQFSSEGKFIGFVDSGDFVIKTADDGSFVVTDYRMTY